MPEDMTGWLAINGNDNDLATALAAVHNHVGRLGHELDESDDEWLLYSHDQWWGVAKSLYSSIIDRMRQTNNSGITNYDLNVQGLYYLVKPFMELHSFRDGNGWWIN